MFIAVQDVALAPAEGLTSCSHLLEEEHLEPACGGRQPEASEGARTPTWPAGCGPADIGPWLVGPHGPAAEVAVPAAAQTRWERAQGQAKTIAEFLQTRPHPTADFNAFLDRHAQALQDPFVVTALSEHLSPSELAQLAIDVLEEDLTSEGHAEGWNRRPTEVLALLGTTFVLATGGQDLADPSTQGLFDQAVFGLRTADGRSASELADQFLDQLRVHGPRAVASDLPAFEGMSLFQLLTQLGGYAASQNPELVLGSQFYTTLDGERAVAEVLVEWEHANRDTVQDYPGRIPPVPLLIADDPALHDPLHDLFLLSDGPYSTLRQAVSGEKTSLATPAGATNQREHARRAAVREFLLTNSPVQDTKLNLPVSMVRYLTGHRVHRGPAGATMGFRDEGEAFGRMLAQVAAPLPPPPNMTVLQAAAYPAADKSRVLVGGEFLLGYQDGMDAGTGLGPQAAKVRVARYEFGDRSPALRRWAGYILAPHVKEIARSLVYNADYLLEAEVEAFENWNSDRYRLEIYSVRTERLIAEGGLLSDLGRVRFTPDLTDAPTPLELLRVSAIVKMRKEIRESLVGEPDYKTVDDMERIFGDWQTLLYPIEHGITGRASLEGLLTSPLDELLARDLGRAASMLPLENMPDIPAWGATIISPTQDPGDRLLLPANAKDIVEVSRMLPVGSGSVRQDMQLAFLIETSTLKVFPGQGGDDAEAPYALRDPDSGRYIRREELDGEQWAERMAALQNKTPIGFALSRVDDGLRRVALLLKQADADYGDRLKRF
ncbi:hypothetical protein [Buchananella hordeovulneris]|uniref:hypothetical protein n=1 Tax=Buchananella hordeovulneris TaxID=52770 RepID=UPI000F5F134A|nr:hypothetical protein [Buchananella hordeovulneris]RRD43421.1 hypothetical protein EII13_06835 [Buchananella hordeovulneris]